jgi:hypothetical protein
MFFASEAMGHNERSGALWGGETDSLIDLSEHALKAFGRSGKLLRSSASRGASEGSVAAAEQNEVLSAGTL